MVYDNPNNPFAGWSGTTAVCAAVGALGGVLVALSIKLADSIMKTIATTGAIVLTTSSNPHPNPNPNPSPDPDPDPNPNPNLNPNP